MRVVLLAHSFVGHGAQRAIFRSRHTQIFSVGYSQREVDVPAPRVACDLYLGPRESPLYANWPTGDILISANWRHWIPPAYFDEFPLAVNLHGSDLRRGEFPGRAPIQRQIAAGRTFYTLSLHRLTSGIDRGTVLSQAHVGWPQVPRASQVYREFGRLAAHLIEGILP